MESMRSALGAGSPIPVIKRVALLFALLAFVVQGYVLQTHIHQFAKPTHGTLVASHLPTPSGKTDPVDVGGCRLCQHIVHGNALLAASEVAVPTSPTFVPAVFSALRLIVEAIAPTFVWQSRAPPLRS